MSVPSVFHIVLPICTELPNDIFLNILKCAVARSVMDEDCAMEAFMSAMNGQSVNVQMDDISRKWIDFTTIQEQSRSYGILGFWAVAHFPSLGKQLFGKKYEPPQRDDVCINESTKIKSENLDDIVFSKLKLRVLELSVNESTFTKLKFFVKVPGFVAKKGSGVIVSRKMESFDVDKDYVDRCWQALKCGVFTLNSDEEWQHQTDTVMYSCVTTALGEIDDQVNSNPTEPPAKRSCRRRNNISTVTNTNQGNESFATMMPENSELDFVNGLPITSLPENAREIGLWTLVVNIQDDIRTLSKSIQHQGALPITTLEQKFVDQTAALTALRNETEANTKLCTKVHNELTIIRDQDSQFKTQIETLRNQLHEAEKRNVQQSAEQIDLRSEADLYKKLCEKYQSDLSASRERDVHLQEEIETLRKQLHDAEKINVEKAAEQKALQLEADGHKKLCEKYREQFSQFESLCSQKQEFEKMNVELRAEIDTYKKLTEKYQSDLSASQAKLAEAERVEREVFELKRNSDNIAAKLRSEIETLLDMNSRQNEFNATTQTGDDEGLENLSASSPKKQVLVDNNEDDNKGAQSDEFDANDPMVKKYHAKLRALEFGWMKFGNKKTALYSPGFVHPIDKDGKRKAQKITDDGYPTSAKYVFFDHSVNIPEELKLAPEKAKLKKLNEKFKLNFE